MFTIMALFMTPTEESGIPTHHNSEEMTKLAQNPSEISKSWDKSISKFCVNLYITFTALFVYMQIKETVMEYRTEC